VRTAVGLDVGSSAIAAAELRSGPAGPTLARVATEPLPEGLVAAGEVVDAAGLAEHIRRLWRAGRFTNRRVRLGVANQRVAMRTLDLPAIDDPAERLSAVRFAAAEEIPIPAEVSVVDYQPVGRHESDSGPRDEVVVVSAHREMVSALTGAARAAGLRPMGVDLEAFALIRALLPAAAAPGDPDAPAQVVCHVGASLTNVVVAAGGRCQLTRLVGFGGRALTDAVAQDTGLAVHEAEDLKVACGLIGDVPADVEPGLAARVRHALALGAQPLALELRRSLAYYAAQGIARPIERVVLSGGGARCLGLERYLQQALDLPVEPGRPLRHLADGGGTPDALAARATVAVGLAMDGGAGAP
jgi:type IV pilus assembly protein PilM